MSPIDRPLRRYRFGVEVGFRPGHISKAGLRLKLVGQPLQILETDFENRSLCFYLFDLVNHWFLEPLRSDARLQGCSPGRGFPSQPAKREWPRAERPALISRLP